jgi:hypothetical protein
VFSYSLPRLFFHGCLQSLQTNSGTVEGVRSPRRLSFVRWRVILGDSQSVTFFSNRSSAQNFEVAQRFLYYIVPENSRKL